LVICFVFVVLDRLQYLTVAGFHHACSMGSFKKKTVQTMTPQDLPKDFLFKVERDVVDLITVSQMNTFASAHKQHILHQYNNHDNSSDSGSDDADDDVHNDVGDSGSIYPDDASTEKLVKLLVTHVTQIQALRNAESIQILVIGCEDVFFILELYVRLCWHLQYSVKCVHITVIDKNSFVVDAWNQLWLSVKVWFPELHVQFDLMNFMVFNNALMSNFDVAVTFIVGSLTPAFALKFTLLSLQHNTRPYYRSSKLFLASRSLFAFARRHVNSCSLTFIPQVEMTYRCRTRDTDEKDLCHLTRVGEQVSGGVVEYIYKFAYHRTSHEDPTAQFMNSALLVSFQKAVKTEIVEVANKMFSNLFTKDLFADVEPNKNKRVLLTNDRVHGIKRHPAMLIVLRHCTVTIDVDRIHGLANIPVYDDAQCGTLGSKYFETLLHFVNKTKGLQYLSLYIQTNVHNALGCLQSIQCAIFQYMRFIFKAVDVDFNSVSFLPADIKKAVSLKLKTNVTTAAPNSINFNRILNEVIGNIDVTNLESSAWTCLWTDTSNKYEISAAASAANTPMLAQQRGLPAVVEEVCSQPTVTFNSEDLNVAVTLSQLDW
jgi:hypothetical protein